MESTSNVVHERLARLEKSNRRLRLGFFVVTCAGVLPYVLAATNVVDVFQAREIRAEKIDLLNGAEVVASIKAYMPADSVHGPGVGLYGADGKLNVAFPRGSQGGDIHIYNSNSGTLAATLYADSMGGALLMNGRTKRTMFLRGDADGGILSIYNQTGKFAATLANVEGAAGGILSLGDSAGNRRVYVGMSSTGHPILQLSDTADKAVFAAETSDRGAHIIIKDGQLNELAYLGVTTDGTSMFTLSDPGGRSIEMGDDGKGAYLNMGRGGKQFFNLAARPDKSWLTFQNSLDKPVLSMGAYNFSDEGGRASGKLFMYDETGAQSLNLSATNGVGGVLTLKNAAGNTVVWAGPSSNTSRTDLYMGGIVNVNNRSGDAVAFMQGNYARGLFCTGPLNGTTCVWNSPIE